MALSTEARVNNQNADGQSDGFCGVPLAAPGDCGFNAIAAQSAVRRKAKVIDIQPKIAKLAASLRARCVIWLKKNSSWQASWYIGPWLQRKQKGLDGA